MIYSCYLLVAAELKCRELKLQSDEADGKSKAVKVMDIVRKFKKQQKAWRTASVRK